MITQDMTIDEVVQKCPKTRYIFLKYGICERCGGHFTIERRAKLHGINIEKLVKDLNRLCYRN